MRAHIPEEAYKEGTPTPTHSEPVLFAPRPFVAPPGFIMAKVKAECEREREGRLGVYRGNGRKGSGEVDEDRQ